MQSTWRTAIVALLMGGCAVADHPFEPAASLAAGQPWLRTDRTEYVIRDEGSLQAVDFDLTYRNHLERAVAVPTCHSPMRPILEKQVDGAWVHVFSPVELMCITPPLVIGAGTTHRFTYALRADAHDVRRWLDSGDGALGGTYRLLWLVGLNDGANTPLPLEYRVSNPFLLSGR